MVSEIHPTAIVDPSARLAGDVVIGPWAYIGPNVELGEGCEVGPRATIERDTTLGVQCRIGNGAVIGSDPQDLKYRGEPTFLKVGDRVNVREYVTINRPTGENETTVIGNDCLFMAYAHVAHNCELGDRVIMANTATLGGHIQVGHGAILGGLVAVHQFVHIGKFSIVGGSSGVRKDILPFTMASGFPCSPHGLNIVGLKRRGFSRERMINLRHAYRIIFRSGMRLDEATQKLKEDFAGNQDVQLLIDFIENTQRGLAR